MANHRVRTSTFGKGSTVVTAASHLVLPAWCYLFCSYLYRFLRPTSCFYLYLFLAPTFWIYLFLAPTIFDLPFAPTFWPTHWYKLLCPRSSHKSSLLSLELFKSPLAEARSNKASVDIKNAGLSSTGNRKD